MTAIPDEVLLAASPLRAPGTELHWRHDGSRRSPILKNRRQGRYHRLSSGSAWIWSLCDGRRSVAAIAEHIAARGGPPDTAKIVASVRRLAVDGLVEGVEIAPPPRTMDEPGFAAACRRLLTWRVAFPRADASLAWLYRHAGFIAFTRAVRGLLLALIALGLVAFVAMWQSQPDPFATLSGRWLWFLPVFFYGCTLLHEMGHAMATKHFGREVIGVGFGWFWIGPFFFVDTSDMWLAGRRERILVSLAGAISDLIMAGACMVVALVAAPPVSAMAFAMAAALYLIVLGNMSPLLEYDGYYALADLLDRPNLRRQSLGHLFAILRQRPIPWRDLGRDRVASTYAIGSLIYMAVLLTMNAWFNHAFFSGLFQGTSGWWPGILAWGITLGLLAIFLVGLVGDILRLARPPQTPDKGT
jgi:putative peptide zinc metalloprotease protein